MRAYILSWVKSGTIIGLLALIFTSCRSVRLLEDHQALVTSVELRGIDADFKEQAEEYVQKEIRPNSRINLFIYNFANGKNGHYRTDDIRKVGEPPSILDSSLVEISRSQIEKYLFNKGFFNARVESAIEVEKQRAHIAFTAEPGPMFHVRKIERDFSDPAQDSIYLHYPYTIHKLSEGMRYDTDSLVHEREAIYSEMRDNGYYDFLRQYVQFEVDTNLQGHLADIKILVANPEGKSAHQVYTIDTTRVVIFNSAGNRTAQASRDTLDRNMLYLDYSGRYRAKPINRYIFLKSGDKYNNFTENLTYDRLYELNSFKSIKVSYQKTDSSHLNATYELIPMKRMANRIEGEYTFNSGRSGFNIGNTYTNRNLFGGSEQLEIKLGYGVLFDSRIKGNSLFDRVFNRDWQLGATLTIPRIIVPFVTPSLGKNSMPRTTFSTNWQIFDQLNTYSNRYLINSVSYLWNDTRYKVHNLSPLILEYRVGRLDPDFMDQLEKEGYQLYIESNNRKYFGLGSQYSFTYNTVRLNELADFSYFRGAVDVSGNTLALISNFARFKENSSGEKTIWKVPYLQYAKLEADYRLYRHFGGERQLVIRVNPGVAVPYGNNREFLIFEKEFYSGGMSDVRAWQARTLGPGGYNREVLADSLRLNLRNLDQLGEVKITTNVEYRFKIMNDFLGAKLKGASFVDMGNIWRIRHNDINPNGEFKWDTFLNQMAIGAGAGLRFDLDYFVFRFDVGLKIRDPQFAPDDRWVIGKLFDSKAFKQQYEETHFPDTYNFFQYNFGIGMPF